jgi:hypothetical protein
MATVAVSAQRELSRELLPAVQEKMKSSYQAVNVVERGAGTFMRMKGAMERGSEVAVHGMFDSATDKLMRGIKALIKRLKTMIGSTAEVIGKAFDNVFSICWDDQQSEALISPEAQKAIRECRDKLLPELNELAEIQRGACELLGIEREEVELDVGVTVAFIPVTAEGYNIVVYFFTKILFVFFSSCGFVEDRRTMLYN